MILEHGRRQVAKEQALRYPVERVEVPADSLLLRGNFVLAPDSIDAALILHGAAATGDPLNNLLHVQQLFADERISTLAVRLRGVGEGDAKSGGNYYSPLIRRVDDGLHSLGYLLMRTETERLHLVGGSMNGHTASLIAADLGKALDSLTLVAAAAYPHGADQVAIGPEFSEIIRDPNKDLTTSPAFSAIETYTGPVHVIYGEHDPVIDPVVRDTYGERAMRNGSSIIIPEVGHELLSNTKHPAIEAAYIDLARTLRAQ